MDAAEKCEWDLNSPAGLKAATKELVGLVKDKLDLPDRDLNRLLGNMVVNLKEKGATGIMEEIINKYGFKKAKEAQKEASIEALEKTCGNPKNAAMVMAFQELANYYFKGKFLFKFMHLVTCSIGILTHPCTLASPFCYGRWKYERGSRLQEISGSHHGIGGRGNARERHVVLQGQDQGCGNRQKFRRKNEGVRRDRDNRKARGKAISACLITMYGS
jgi:hypothetical protein